MHCIETGANEMERRFDERSTSTILTTLVAHGVKQARKNVNLIVAAAKRKLILKVN